MMCSVLANMATSNNKTEITSNTSPNSNENVNEDRDPVLRTHSEIRSEFVQKSFFKKIRPNVLNLYYTKCEIKLKNNFLSLMNVS